MEPMLFKKRWGYAVWLVLICAFAALHALHLNADFPNHTPWYSDWAKYTDEGWYGNAAVRAHLFGSWYLLGDFNPAAAVPVWPFLEWVLFFLTGVTVEAARGLAVAFFFLSLALSYTLLRARGPRWVALLAVTLLVTSPFLYCFSRLAILEPMLTTLTLAALNLGVRLPGFRRPVWVSVVLGLLFTVMMLTKTTAVFLLPALGWAMVLPLWERRKLAVRCLVAAAGVFAIGYGLWLALVVRCGLLADLKYFFFVNKYPKPPEFYWPLVSLWWSLHAGLWVDHILIPLAGVAMLASALAWWSAGGRKLLLDPVFGSSVLAVAGYILFMTYQNHPQPRYFAVVVFFICFIVAQGAGELLGTKGAPGLLLGRRNPVTAITRQCTSADDRLPVAFPLCSKGSRFPGPSEIRLQT
jgi:4-amino-4-deoxy-L-arabinose transferase-like glycosyltransferase